MGNSKKQYCSLLVMELGTCPLKIYYMKECSFYLECEVRKYKYRRRKKEDD